VRHKEVAPTDCRCNKITRRLPNRVAFGVTLAYTILFLYHDYDQLATEPTTLSATETKPTIVKLPPSCLSEYSNAPSWTAFLNHTATLAPMYRCYNPTTARSSRSATAWNETNHILGFPVAPDEDCHCPDPFEPLPRRFPTSWALPWSKAFQRNLDLIASTAVATVAASTAAQEGITETLAEYHDLDNYDVVILGDSITEGWMGTLVGSPMEHLKDLPTIYEELFASTQPQLSPGHTGSVHGLALGIAGDFTSHLLYRLLHGEAAVLAKVYWITIGINDFLQERCSMDAIVAGVIQIVETLWATHAHRNVTIVVSSILPWGATSLLEQNTKWEAIRGVNRALECYAQSRRSVLGTSGSTGSHARVFHSQCHGYLLD
jgi:hypothetical protein